MTAAELAAALRKDASNVRRTAAEMVEEGLLEYRRPRRRAGPGRPSDKAYGLAEGKARGLNECLAESAPPGSLQQSQQLVFAEIAPEHVEDLFDVLGSAELVGQAAWAALCEGNPQEYLVVFDGDDPVAPALDLMGALSGAQIPCRRAALGRVVPIQDLTSSARRAGRAAARARLRRETRRVARGA